jgi:hypothetical protein
LRAWGSISPGRTVKTPGGVSSFIGAGTGSSFKDSFTGEGNLTVFISNDLGGDFIPDFNFILDGGNAVVGQFTDMNHPFFARQNLDKSAEGE